jgi:hypothetical protein
MRVKELVELRMESRWIAIASDDDKNLCELPEVWQAKGLSGGGQNLEDGTLTGGTGRGTIPPDMFLL